MSKIKLTPVSGQIDTFEMSGASGQPISVATSRQNGGVIGCTETITLVHHIKNDDDTYTCHTANKASWFSKVTISTSADGAKPVNTFDVRVFDDFSGVVPALGDYVVKGIVEGIESPTDLKNMVYFRITAISDNRRGGLAHWRLSGQ